VANDQTAVGAGLDAIERENINVNNLTWRSTLSFMRSTSVVPPAMKRIWAPCWAVADLAAACFLHSLCHCFQYCG
jgi:hypothetical protein